MCPSRANYTSHPLHEDHLPRVAVEAAFAAQHRNFAANVHNLNDKFSSYVALGEEELVRHMRELHVTKSQLLVRIIITITNSSTIKDQRLLSEPRMSE